MIENISLYLAESPNSVTMIRLGIEALVECQVVDSQVAHNKERIK